MLTAFCKRNFHTLRHDLKLTENDKDEFLRQLRLRAKGVDELFFHLWHNYQRGKYVLDTVSSLKKDRLTVARLLRQKPKDVLFISIRHPIPKPPIPWMSAAAWSEYEGYVMSGMVYEDLDYLSPYRFPSRWNCKEELRYFSERFLASLGITRTMYGWDTITLLNGWWRQKVPEKIKDDFKELLIALVSNTLKCDDPDKLSLIQDAASLLPRAIPIWQRIKNRYFVLCR